MTSDPKLTLSFRRDYSVANTHGSSMEVIGAHDIDPSDVRKQFPFLHGMEEVLYGLWENSEGEHTLDSVQLYNAPFKIVFQSHKGLVKMDFFSVTLENLQKQVASRNEILRDPFHWSKSTVATETPEVGKNFSHFIDDVEYFCGRVQPVDGDPLGPHSVDSKDFIFLKELCQVAREYIQLLPPQ